MTDYLVDTSAVHRADRLSAGFTRLASAGRLATCGAVDLELGYSMRGPHEHQRLTTTRLGLPRAAVTDQVLLRALEVQGMLARRGWHRIPPADLIIAAAAELTGMTVLHYDSDFERIAAVTGQPHKWAAPRGTL